MQIILCHALSNNNIQGQHTGYSTGYSMAGAVQMVAPAIP